MEGVTLLESGTTRVHFALVKRLEEAKSAQQADDIVLDAVLSAKDALASGRTAALGQSTIASQLLVILHSLQVYPHAASSARANVTLDIGFTLVPALHLLATAKNARGIQIAYSVLIELLQQPLSSLDQSGTATSLLLLNTMRQHLGHGAPHSRPTLRSPETSNNDAASAALDYARKHMALRAIVSGTPAGSDVVPALYGPVSSLLTSRDATIQSLAVEALLVLSAYRHEEDDKGVARATWEQVRQVAVTSIRRSGKEKAQEASVTREESMGRAFLTAAGVAFSQKVLSADEYVDDVLKIAAKDEISVWLVLRVFRSLSDAVRQDGQDVKPETRDKIVEWGTQILTAKGNNYPVLVEAARLGSLIANFQATESQVAFIDKVWMTGKAHLHAANANRKMVALAVLEALLPFKWPSPLLPGDIQLNEAEMAALMGMLTDGDGSIRKRALTLFKQIDTNILQGHLKALQEAVQKDDCEGVQRIVLLGVEVLGVQCQKEDFASVYAVQLAIFLGVPAMLEVLADDVVEEVAAKWREAEASSNVIIAFVAGLQPGRQLSPTVVLLLATLVCECIGPENVGDGESTANLLTKTSLLLPSAGEANVALQEALLIALIKLAALCRPADVRVALPVLSKYAESTSASLVKERVRQVSALSHDDRSEAARARFRRASLMVTLDIVDACMAAQSQVSSSSAPTNATATPERHKARPLQYEAYAAPSSAESTVNVSADLM